MEGVFKQGNIAHLVELRSGSIFRIVGMSEVGDFLLVGNGDGSKLCGRVIFDPIQGEYKGLNDGTFKLEEHGWIYVRARDWLDPESCEVRAVVSIWEVGRKK